MKLIYTVDEYGKDILQDTSNIHQVMMEWEKPYMEKCMEYVEPRGDVLEIGFGLGYSATKLMTYSNISSYTVIECSPEVWPKIDEFILRNSHISIQLIKGRWEDTIHTCGIYDVIFFDDYDSHNNTKRFHEFLHIVGTNNTKIGSIVGVFSQEPVAVIFPQQFIRSNENFPIDIPDNCRYVKGDHMCINKLKKVAEFETDPPPKSGAGTLIGNLFTGVGIPSTPVLTKNFFVIDNFYNSPGDTRKCVTYQLVDTHKTTGSYATHEILKDFENIIGNQLSDFEIGPTVLNGRWKCVTQSAPGCGIVKSSFRWNAILFLTPDPPPGTGLQFYRDEHKDLNNIHIWNKTDFISNKYNRLVIFNGKIPHMNINNFGNNINSGCLFQEFKFN